MIDGFCISKRSEINEIRSKHMLMGTELMGKKMIQLGNLSKHQSSKQIYLYTLYKYYKILFELAKNVNIRVRIKGMLSLSIKIELFHFALFCSVLL